jgi:hypothetical protein
VSVHPQGFYVRYIEHLAERHAAAGIEAPDIAPASYWDARRRLELEKSQNNWIPKPNGGGSWIDAMSATTTDMGDFIEAMCRQIPDDIHPSAERNIAELFWEMRSAADNPAEVSRLMQLVGRYVVRELNFNAENAQHFSDDIRGREAWRYRRQAGRFAARWNVSP